MNFTHIIVKFSFIVLESQLCSAENIFFIRANYLQLFLKMTNFLHIHAVKLLLLFLERNFLEKILFFFLKLIVFVFFLDEFLMQCIPIYFICLFKCVQLSPTIMIHFENFFFIAFNFVFMNLALLKMKFYLLIKTFIFFPQTLNLQCNFFIFGFDI